MTTDLCCREKGSQEIKPPRKRTHFRQKDLAVKRRCPMDRPIQAYQIFVRAKRLKISHQELFGHGKSLPPRIATFHFWGKHPFSGPSISQETLRIENPSVSWVCVFLPWEGVRWRWLFQGRWCQRLEWRSRLTLLMRGECERVFGGLWYGEVFVAWFLLCALFRWEAIRCYHWSLQVHTFRAMATTAPERKTDLFCC